jgi:hypothetical protein
MGAKPGYQDLARSLGRAIGERGWQLVYGGGRAGLMGAVADATLAAGGTVVGVIPESLMKSEVGHAGLTELHVVQNMHQRKQMMTERADAFVAMPGGIGTFEELFEVWTWAHLGYLNSPLGLLDTERYWEPMVAFLKHSVDEGFMGNDQMAMLHIQRDVETLLNTLHQASAKTSHRNLGQI